MGSEEHLHQEMEINYFKIKVVPFIINFDWNYTISNEQV